MATLTFAYESSTAVLGPLALEPEVGTYDLCALHAERTSVPVGWEVIRLPLEPEKPTSPFDDDDLLALAAAVREVGLRDPAPPAPEPPPGGGVVRHLRVVRDDH